jgi:small subunit ribosomal protein S15
MEITVLSLKNIKTKVGNIKMARMHSRKKGKSGSSVPAKIVPSWAPYKGKEVEKLIIKYAKAGNTASEIGIVLRDSYGINSVKALTEKKITQVLTENKLAKELPEDLLNLIKRLIAINQHFEKNRQDQTAKRGQLLTNSKIRRLIKYYKSSKRLPSDWKLDQKRLKMYIE